jgi:hypothetical protein
VFGRRLGVEIVWFSSLRGRVWRARDQSRQLAVDVLAVLVRLAAIMTPVLFVGIALKVASIRAPLAGAAFVASAVASVVQGRRAPAA